jgi:hypothetical protein
MFHVLLTFLSKHGEREKAKQARRRGGESNTTLLDFNKTSNSRARKKKKRKTFPRLSPRLLLNFIRYFISHSTHRAHTNPSSGWRKTRRALFRAESHIGEKFAKHFSIISLLSLLPTSNFVDCFHNSSAACLLPWPGELFARAKVLRFNLSIYILRTFSSSHLGLSPRLIPLFVIILIVIRDPIPFSPPFPSNKN